MGYIDGMDQGWRTHDLAVGAGEAGTGWIDHEWVLTNGTGAYSMGTVDGVNRRRYHGLLVACERPPVGRVVAVNQVLERLVVRDGGREETIDLTACMFRSLEAGVVFAPEGRRWLKRFEKGLSVRWTYVWKPTGSEKKGREIRFVRELVLHWGQQAASVHYEVQQTGGKPGAVSLRLAPMVTLRDFHGLLKKDWAGPVRVDAAECGSVVVGRGETKVSLRCEGVDFKVNDGEQEQWWYGVYYPFDAERGQEDREDYFVPGWFEKDFGRVAEASATLTMSLGGQHGPAFKAMKDVRVEHLKPMLSRLGEARAGGQEGLIKKALVIAADDFVVGRRFGGKDLKTIIAGYPWFADWGRDTFIALPGLLLSTGRFDEARSILSVFAGVIRNGLVPNRFDDYGESAAHYNSVDASLWFVHAALEYLEASGDRGSWDRWLADAAVEVLEAFVKGTDFEIRMMGDGLIWAGSAQTQLTWMDAACSGVVFTPRQGKAVEINALWYSALAGVGKQVTKKYRATAEHYAKLAKRVKRSFEKVFWDAQKGWLRDHAWIGEDGQERVSEAMRPNQVFAVSLARSPLSLAKQRLVMKALREHLLTPYGLRTLPADDPGYHGRYTGGPFERDRAYHQGTVWPWLIGPYAEGLLRVGKFSAASKNQATAAIEPLLEELAGSGIGQLHEIHEADPPHRAVGCMAQAWSVAEVLRVSRLLEQPSAGR